MVRMNKRGRSVGKRAAVVVLVALALAACGDDGSTDATSGSSVSTGSSPSVPAGGGYDYGAPAVSTTVAAPSATAAASGATSSALTLKVGSTPLGSILVDGAGETLYVFTNDVKNKSNCTAACLDAWPPLYGVPVAGAGVDASKLGSFTTADGKTQATIDGRPLYFFAVDSKAGDTLGQNVGGVWFVVDGTGVLKKS
jgi:predicted lipoprotein with Yx(FWY)xxD motif